MRASFIMWNMAARPRFAAPTSWPTSAGRTPRGNRPSPKLSTVFVVPRKAHLVVEAGQGDVVALAQ